MDEKKYRFVNIFLIFGFLFLLFALITGFASPDILSSTVVEIFLVLQITLGAIITTTAIALTKKGYQLFTGLLIFGWGFFTYLVVNVLPYDLKTIWPAYGILASIFIFIDGFYIYRRLKFGFTFPAFILLAMGIVYLLFSLKIIKLPFLTFVYITGPVLIVCVVLFFIIFFELQKRHNKLIFDEDGEAFQEEKIPTKFEDTYN